MPNICLVKNQNSLHFCAVWTALPDAWKCVGSWQIRHVHTENSDAPVWLRRLSLVFSGRICNKGQFTMWRLSPLNIWQLCVLRYCLRASNRHRKMKLRSKHVFPVVKLPWEYDEKVFMTKCFVVDNPKHDFNVVLNNIICMTSLNARSASQNAARY